VSSGSFIPLASSKEAKHVFLIAPLFHFSVSIAKKRNPDTVGLLIHQLSVLEKINIQQRAKNVILVKETITILKQAKAFLNFYYHQKENISKIILEKCMTEKEAKSCCPRPRTGQFSRTWRV